MECIDGANVHQVLRSGPLPLSCALEMAAEVARATCASGSCTCVL